MRKFMLLFLFINLCTAAYNQVIEGTILDEKTKKPILSASIYFNGTFVGTSSDQNGKFELDISKYSSLPLTISSIGYYSVTLIDFSKGGRIVITLTPMVYELEEELDVELDDYELAALETLGDLITMVLQALKAAA